MDKYYRMAVLLDLMEHLKEAGSWCGETHVQKATFFLQEVTGVPLGFDFIIYRHGPFSFELRETLGEMRGASMIDAVSRKPFGASLEVTEPGRRHLERFPRTVASTRGAAEAVARFLGSRDVYELERLATALFVMREQETDEPERLVARIVELKPHVDPERAAKAVHDVAVFRAAGVRRSSPTLS
jgi:hypothetical protein